MPMKPDDQTKGMTMPDWKIGDFAMHKGTPVRIEAETNPGRFGVELVSNYERGCGICCGGHVYSYGADELTPLRDVETIVLCTAYAAKRAVEAAKSEIIRQERIFEANVAALDALKKARETAQSEAH